MGGNATNGNLSWRDAAPCASLPLTTVDAIFFPGSGGKPTKAKAFCESRCPFQKQCLLDAIRLDLDGFFAGTTKDERHVMRDNWQIPIRSLVDIMEDLIPKAPVKQPGRARYLHVLVTSATASYDELDTMTNPLDTL